MKIKQLNEILFKFYSEGRPKATARTIREADILQMITISYGAIIRQRFLESKKLDEFGEPDYSFTSPILEVKEFPLSEPNTVGMRRADMNGFDLYRLPNNGHITNMYPIGGSCGSEEINKITLVKAGEEKFYTNPKFNFFKYASIVGRGMNTYNLPPCVTKIAIETTYNSDDIDITLDIAHEVSLQVLNILFKEKQFPVPIIDNSFDGNAGQLKQRLTQYAAQQPVE